MIALKYFVVYQIYMLQKKKNENKAVINNLVNQIEFGQFNWGWNDTMLVTLCHMITH